MERETRATPVENGKGWRDHLGFVGPFRPGVGPRTDPTGGQPTGPEIGERLPPVVAPDQHGRMVDVHRERADGPLIMIFYRSAVW